MSRVLEFVLPLPPTTNRMYRRCGRRMVLSDEARKYKAFVAECRDGDLMQGDILVQLDVYRAQKSGDLDGKIKCVLDALQGVAYVDDKQITEIIARRFDDKEFPRLEVTVTELAPAALPEKPAKKPRGKASTR